MLTPLFVNILAFLAVFLAVFAANAVLMDMHASERRRLKKRLEEQSRERQRSRARTSPVVQDFSKIAAEAMAEKRGAPSLIERMQFIIDQSGLNLTLGHLAAFSLLSGSVVALALGALTENLLVAVAVAPIGAAVPLVYLQIKRRQRLERLRTQLPDAFELMGRVLRAGQTISQGIQAVAEEFSRPISLEFLYCSEQMNLGLPPEAALRDLGRRTGLLEVRIFVLAVIVHRQTGGNLAQLLDKLGHVVRERFRIRGMIRSLTAQGRFQAGILLSLPPFMFALLLVLHREYELLLLDYPGLIAASLLLMLAGALWIRKIVNFDF